MNLGARIKSITPKRDITVHNLFPQSYPYGSNALGLDGLDRIRSNQFQKRRDSSHDQQTFSNDIN
jgi:hypothetical protein